MGCGISSKKDVSQPKRTTQQTKPEEHKLVPKASSSSQKPENSPSASKTVTSPTKADTKTNVEAQPAPKIPEKSEIFPIEVDKRTEKSKTPDNKQAESADFPKKPESLPEPAQESEPNPEISVIPEPAKKAKMHEEGQAGGHGGTLIFEGDKLLKKAKQSEIAFFEWLYSPNQTDSIINEIKKYAPKFYGIEERNGERYVSMENLLTGYENPNIMDCKLGKITWTSHHSEETKRNQEAKNKDTTTGSLGFRISGIVIKDDHGKKVESWAKNEGFFGINEHNIHEQFLKIVTQNGHLNKDAINLFITETQKLLDFFERQKVKHFVASSVFYVCGKNQKHQVRFIDFAHAIDANGKTDENVIDGLQNVIKVWERIRGPVMAETHDIATSRKNRFVFRNDKILKKTSAAEIDFYTELNKPSLTDKNFVELKKFVPNFYGVGDVDGSHCVVLENLLFGVENPSILDVKIGKITWTPHHSILKQRQKQIKVVTTTSGTVSYRISGLIIRENNNIIESWDKVQGYVHTNHNNIHHHLAKLVLKNKKFNSNNLELIISETTNLLNWFKHQTSKHFFTSSLLYIVGDNKINVKIIDFEYTTQADSKIDHSKF